MKKIGFIDYFLDEWHANNYPKMIKEATEGEYQVCYAWAYREPPTDGKPLISNEEWAEKFNVELCGTMEEVIEKSDYLIVLSPDYPEMHEELCKLPLASGKRTYVDKTFAPDKESAIRIFENADTHGTKCYSSSALRFAAELDEIDTDIIYKIYSEGPGTLEMYSIHQIEPVVCLMKKRAKRIMFLGDELHPSYIIEFEDGRLAQMYHRKDETRSFRITVVNEINEAKHYEIKSDYFGLFIKSMLAFFETGEVPVPHEQTIDVIAARTAAIEACKTPYTWIEL